MKKNIDYEKIISRFVFFTLVISIVFLVIRIAAAPTVNIEGLENVRVKGDYVLMLSQCILGVVAMLLPGLFQKKLDIIIPHNMLILYAIFLYCAIFLGEVRSYYYDVPHWDTILHGFSGAMMGALGFSFITLLNNEEKIPVTLSPLFVALFTFSFAITLGVVWEIYEFTFDGVLGLNMQKFMLEDGTQLIGREALSDTMKDLIVDSIGAFIMSLIGYISLKYKKGWIDGLQILKKKNKKG